MIHDQVTTKEMEFCNHDQFAFFSNGLLSGKIFSMCAILNDKTICNIVRSS